MYHPPAAGAARERAVLLCYPGVHEYNMAHWAFRKLAGSLAAAGLHVLRFDYSCTGDSFGESADATLPGWIEDVGTAAAELRDLSGASAVSLVGMRLGAAIATEACRKGLQARELVLWEPVATGKEYLAELSRMHALRTLQLLSPGTAEDELMGFALPASMRDALENLSLKGSPPAVRRATLIVSAPRPDLAEALPGARVEVVAEDAAARGEREAALLSTRAIAAITSVLA